MQILWMKSISPTLFPELCKLAAAGRDIAEDWREGKPALSSLRQRTMLRDFMAHERDFEVHHYPAVSQ